jgi:phosphoribosylaminoimidazolecarboxamide formyltransferase/IMP cyclohydrolase
MASKKSQKYALISVFNKAGIVDFAEILISLNYKIISTGGTAKTLSENNIPIIPIQKITGNPESFDGRMKTISFQIESGILFDRKNSKHVREAKELSIKPIDIVICNLYPFEKTISSPDVALKDAIESIDVGGPTMIRAAAKNFENVLVIIDPKDYKRVGESLRKNKSDSLRQALASKAFYHLSFYDSQIAKFLNRKMFPDEISIGARKNLDLRYGENPHQKACFYSYPNNNFPLNNLQKQWGRDLSLLNLTDINAGLESVSLFKDPCAVVIKHNTPCGIALGKTIKEALERAIESDPESAFGGIIVLNKKMDKKAAGIIGEFKDKRKANIDIVAAPKIDDSALNYLKNIRKSMGIYAFAKIKCQSAKAKELNIKWVNGGLVAQTPDKNIEKAFIHWKVVTKKKPSKKEAEQMKIAWKFISRIKSNTIIVVDKNLPMTRGIGSGQTSRIKAARIALEQSGKFAQGAILASDSFFPFDDSIKLCAKAGIACVIQQGGSINDKISIAAADKSGIAMVFTGRRAFWH